MTLRATIHAAAVLGVGIACAQLAGAMLPVASGIAPVASVAAAEEPSRDDGYIRANEGRFEQWGRKIDRFNETARQTGAEAKRSVDRKLDVAWDDVKRRWTQMKAAGAESRDDAKAALDESWRRLEQAWEDAQS